MSARSSGSPSSRPRIRRMASAIAPGGELRTYGAPLCHRTSSAPAGSATPTRCSRHATAQRPTAVSNVVAPPMAILRPLRIILRPVRTKPAPAAPPRALRTKPCTIAPTADALPDLQSKIGAGTRKHSPIRVRCRPTAAQLSERPGTIRGGTSEQSRRSVRRRAAVPGSRGERRDSAWSSAARWRNWSPASVPI